MDTIYQPTFVFSRNGTLITNRFVEFRKLCATFADDITKGRDPTAKILTRITQFPPLRGVPLLNEAFDLLKDSAFEYHMSRDKGNIDHWLELHDQGDSKGSNPSLNNLRRIRQKDDAFLPKKEMTTCTKVFRKLSQICHKHQQALESLTDAIKEYKELDRKCMEAYRQMNAAADNFNEYANDVDSQNCFKEASFEAHKVYIQMTKEYITCKEKSKLALEKMYPLYKTEKQIREERMNKLDKDLRTMIVREMEDTLTEGMKILTTIAAAARFSPDLIDTIGNFDCAITAEKLYQDLCMKYFHPVINQKHLGEVLGNTFYSSPHVYVMDKDERRFRQHESCISLLDGESKLFRREEHYVWANSTVDVKGKDYMLKLKQDISIKQKFCSADGSLAFGWTRKFGCGNKHYGFYPMNDTRLVR
ncbi:uncharacterized protein LOC132738286 [Ruditapes philippinarum]|uniref:uncharacterized protein LOC132738286 n=1 Tax=Ruditapes philippinarum TaxID=129788 RepID=UPI00295C16A1|nr:uncharacterized protein LOC132738286 [Ruditapes philippinarum]